MPSTPLISIGQLIDRSWELCRNRFTELLSLSSWILIVAILNVIALSLYPYASELIIRDDVSFAEGTGILLFFVSTYLIAPVLTVWMLVTLSRFVKAHVTKRNVSVRMIMQESRACFIPTLKSSILLMLILLLAMVIAGMPASALAILGVLLKSSALIVLANVLLLIGVFLAPVLSVKWMTYYYFAPLLSALENQTPMAALTRSRALVQGRFWEVLFRLVIPKLVFIIFGGFVMYLIGSIVNIVVQASGGVSLDFQLRLNSMVIIVIPIFIVIILNPLVVACDVLLYQSLRERN